MTKLHPVKAHVRRSPEPNPRRRELHECLIAELCRRMMPQLVAALEEALAEFKPEEGLQS